MDQQKFKKWKRLSYISESRAVLKMAGQSGIGDRNKNVRSEMMNKNGVCVCGGEGGVEEMQLGQEGKSKVLKSMTSWK